MITFVRLLFGILCALFVSVAWATERNEQEKETVAPVKLEPGKEITWKFPELPETLHAQVTGKAETPMMTVYLPTDYEPGKKYPLAVFISGAEGMTGDQAGFPRSIVGDKGVICVGLPSFKATIAPLKEDKSNYWSRMYITESDGPQVWKCYSVMLGKVFATVPNIDTKRTVFGGFSNGAHSTTAILSTPGAAGEFLKWFTNFVLAEGGHKIHPATSLKGVHVILLRGGNRVENIFTDTQATLTKSGATWEEYVMVGVEHDFSPAGQAEVKRWFETVVLGQ